MARMKKKEFKLTTLLHGDLWTNNMMFLEDDQGRPTGLKFLDFQMAAIGHPMIDIYYFMYICTDREFRSKHLQECLEEYFNVFQPYLKHSVDMTFQEFLEEFNSKPLLFITGGIGVSFGVSLSSFLVSHHLLTTIHVSGDAQRAESIPDYLEEFSRLQQDG